MSERETELVCLAASGDADACRAIYDAHAGRAAAYFLRCGFARSDADDLVQETFVRAFRSLHTFDAARGELGAWLAAIARNVARRQWTRRRQPDLFDPDLAEDVLAGGDDPGAAAQQREELDAVGECVAALPEPLGRIVRLRYVEGRTTRGIAAAMGMPEATVRLRLTEAHEALRRGLAARGVQA